MAKKKIQRDQMFEINLLVSGTPPKYKINTKLLMTIPPNWL